MSTATRNFMLLLLIPRISLCSIAAEKRITRSQLPEAVRKTADEQSKGLTVRGYTIEIENGQREYEVEMTSNGHSRDVTIAPDGRVLEMEEQVAVDALPATVVSALRQRAGAGLITKVESITKNGVVVAYEAQVKTANKHSEIQIGPQGQPLKHEE